MSTPQAVFHETLSHVIGEALSAAGYALEPQTMHQARGLFRYHKALDTARHAFIEFQTLYHPQSELSRFRVLLLTNSVPVARQATPVAQAHDLAAVIWHVWGAEGVLPADSHWWTYKHAADLAPQLYEAGKLLFGYGVPWLEDRMPE
ncbi:MAG: hypothetical protein ACLFTK_02215 [Anaerolineales bacterium]